MESVFYAYEQIRPDTGEVFYVGKGNYRRIMRVARNHNPHHKNIVAKLARSGMKPEIRILLETHDEAEAFQAEIDRIAYWRSLGVKLCNATDGGEGASGTKHTEEWREAARQRGKERGVPPELIEANRRPKKEEHKRKLAEAARGKRHTPESREKMSAARKGKKLSEDHKNKIGLAHKGKKLSEQQKDYLRTINSSRVVSDETREKLRIAHTGRKHSPEAIENMRVAQAAIRDKKSEIMRGRKKSDDHKRKIGEAHKGRQKTDSEKEKLRASWTPERRARQSELAKSKGFGSAIKPAKETKQ